MNSPNRFRRITSFIVVVGIVCAIGALVYSQLSPNAVTVTPTSASAPQRVSTVNGLTVITLDTATQVQSGIHADALLATNQRAEAIAYGTVLDLQPLIDLRTRYASAQAEAEATKATAAASRQEYQRNRTLYQDNQNTSLKAFQTAQAVFLTDQAKLDAADANVRNIYGAARQQFGELLARWALDPHSPPFERLLNRQDVLLRVTLPLGEKLQAPASVAVIAEAGKRLPASLVSPAAQSDPIVQGNAYIYRTATPIAVGTNIVAYLPTSSQVSQGVFIPPSAIVWYGGQPWAYVQIQPSRFARRPVSQQSPVDGGFFVTDGIKAGERVVVSGAQLLLSEELRPSPSSSGCKDPECD